MADLIEKILGKADDLPVLPHIAMEILTLIDSENSIPADFQSIIENDQVLTLKILKLANSAYYGYPREIISVKEAIVILGLDTLKSLVLSLLTRQMLSKGLDTYGLKRGELWEHSITVAMVARSIAKLMRLANVERFFVGGLLHDTGKLLLDIYLLDNVEKLKAQVNEGGLDFSEAEEMLLGFDHAFIGSKLIEQWNLPSFLENVVRFHHSFSKAPDIFKKDAYIIDIADRLAYSIARGSGTDYKVNKTVNPAEYGKLGLTVADIEANLETIKTSLQSMKF
ncbi:MAG: HDOD domain-containing protein [Brevinematales bacterium]|nr:HDOD domain-containing protein [Brevinematales bacterium]